jgi:hypothetical protein
MQNWRPYKSGAPPPSSYHVYLKKYSRLFNYTVGSRRGEHTNLLVPIGVA